MLQTLMKHTLRMTLRYGLKPVLHPLVPRPLQRRWAELLANANQQAAGVTATPLDLAGVPVEVLVPEGCGRSIILYFHGGAYCIGSTRTHRSITSHLAAYANAAVWVAAYRLAPEAPYPAALTDALQVYETVLARGFEARNIVLAGDSAGAGLALALAVRLRDSGRPLPAGLALICPWVNLMRSRPSAYPDRKDPILSAAWINSCASDYLAGDVTHPEMVSPLLANLEGLPPVLVQAAEEEILLEDARELAAKLRQSGVAVEYQEFEGLWHVFHLHAGWLQAADQALQGIASFVLRVTRAKAAAGAAGAVS